MSPTVCQTFVTEPIERLLVHIYTIATALTVASQIQSPMQSNTVINASAHRVTALPTQTRPLKQ